MTRIQLVRIGDLAETGLADIQTGPFGTQLAAGAYVEAGTPVINVRNIGFGRLKSAQMEYVDEGVVQRLDQHILAHDDIVFARKGAVERHVLIREEQVGWMQGSDCIRLRLGTGCGLNPRYLSFYFSSKYHQKWMLTQGSHGTTMATLNQRIIQNIKVPTPDLLYQRRIADILSAYDDLIENNNRRMALLEEAIHLLYREWFVYLRFPGHKRVEVVDGVPEGWQPTTAGGLVEFDPKTPVAKDRARPFVSMGSLPTHSMQIVGWESRMPKGGAKFKNGDTLLARITPCLENGKTGYVQFLDSHDEVATGSTEFIVMRGLKVPSTWVYGLARSDSFRQHAIGNMTGADGRQRVRRESLNRYEMLRPPATVLQRWDAVTEPMFDEVQRIGLSNQRLREARDLLLPRLMNGTIAI